MVMDFVLQMKDITGAKKTLRFRTAIYRRSQEKSVYKLIWTIINAVFEAYLNSNLHRVRRNDGLTRVLWVSGCVHGVVVEGAQHGDVDDVFCDRVSIAEGRTPRNLDGSIAETFHLHVLWLSGQYLYVGQQSSASVSCYKLYRVVKLKCCLS